MSIKLISEVLTYLSSDTCHLTPAERLALVAIAERARDDSRQAWQGGSDSWCLATIVGVRDLRDVLERLARRKLDVRVVIKFDARGRPVYAHRGMQVAYRLPELTTPTPVAVDQSAPSDGAPAAVAAPEQELSTGESEGAVPAAPKDPEGAVPARKGAVPARKGAVPARKGAVLTAPYPSSTLSTPQKPSSTREATTDPFGAIGATDDEKKIIIERIRKANPHISHLGGYIATMHRNGDLTELLTVLRDAAAAATLQAVLAEARRGPMCEHLVAGGATLHPSTGAPLCPLCRTAGGRQAERAEVELPAPPERRHHSWKPAPTAGPPTAVADGLDLLAAADITPPIRTAPPGIGICVECSEVGEFTIAEDAAGGSHCHMHSRKVAAL